MDYRRLGRGDGFELRSFGSDGAPGGEGLAEDLLTAGWVPIEPPREVAPLPEAVRPEPNGPPLGELERRLLEDRVALLEREYAQVERLVEMGARPRSDLDMAALPLSEARVRLGLSTPDAFLAQLTAQGWDAGCVEYVSRVERDAAGGALFPSRIQIVRAIPSERLGVETRRKLVDWLIENRHPGEAIVHLRTLCDLDGPPGSREREIAAEALARLTGLIAGEGR